MTDIKMIKALGVESMHHNVTSSSSDMDAGDLLSVSINSGGNNIMSTSLMSSASFTSSVSQVGASSAVNNGNLEKPMISSTGGISITHGVSSSVSVFFFFLHEMENFH